MREDRVDKMLRGISSFLVIFMLVSFVISCCMMLFLRILSQNAVLEFTSENITAAAKATLFNVILLSLLLTAIYTLWQRRTVDKPVKQIVEAAERIMEGDFSVQIPHGSDSIGQIADCFNRMAKELSGTETLRTDFIANVSHELKTPLAVIQNYGTLLQQPDLSEEKRLEYAKALTLACRRQASLVTNILKLNKLENQQVLMQSEPFDLSEQICRCLLQFEESWESKDLELQTDIEDGITVSSDEEMLELVWNNLFSNAIKFTQPGGTIGLSIKKEEGRAVVRVSDTGCGISAAAGARIFDKFYQGDTSHAGAGNGLGLALVKRVIDLTGCSISVESEVGKGSVFTVRVECDE